MNNIGNLFTEHAVDVRNDKGFVRQIDVFDSYEEAEYFVENYKESLNEGEYLNIVCITCDCHGNEISVETVW